MVSAYFALLFITWISLGSASNKVNGKANLQETVDMLVNTVGKKIICTFHATCEVKSILHVDALMQRLNQTQDT